MRPAHLAVSNAFAALRLLPMSDRAEDIEILAARRSGVRAHRVFRGAPRIRGSTLPQIIARLNGQIDALTVHVRQLSACAVRRRGI